MTKYPPLKVWEFEKCDSLDYNRIRDIVTDVFYCKKHIFLLEKEIIIDWFLTIKHKDSQGDTFIIFMKCDKS